MSVTEVKHPLVQHKLSYLRSTETPTVHFRKLVEEVTLLLTYEATKDFPTEDVQIETPLERTSMPRISGKKVAVCPILRAGLGMLDGVLTLISGARVGFIGLYRDEETLQPVEYYVKLPQDVADLDIPSIHIGDAVADAVAKDHRARVALLGTSYTMTLPFLRDRLTARGIEVAIPHEALHERIDRSIFGEFSRGVFSEETRRFYVDTIEALDADAVVFGCTELGLLLQPDQLDVPVYDTARVHAQAAVDYAT